MTKDTEQIEIKQEENKSSLNFNNFIDDMIENIPDVQQHVVDAEQAKTDMLNNAVDSSKEKFDPNLHVVGKDGKPSVTKTGKFRKKKNINNPYEVNESPSAKREEAVNVESEASAELIQSLKRNVYDGVFEYKYSDDRHKIHVAATTQYFVESGGVKLTPLQNLLILEGFLALEVARTPKATKKITGLKAWIASKYVKFKGRKKNDSQSNNRPNDVGQDNTSKKDDSEKV